MILSCNSCGKKFVVPDSAITEAGRLVQCSACGNKWKQFPVGITEKKKVISKPVAKKINLKFDLPLVEVTEIKKNKSFVAEKTKIYKAAFTTCNTENKKCPGWDIQSEEFIHDKTFFELVNANKKIRSFKC